LPLMVADAPSSLHPVLAATSVAVRESVALFAYRLFGWTKEIFPAPNG